MNIALDEIEIADRYRRDLGDVESLARSIAEIGLLHPIVINSERRLIAGGRRVAAARLLGWKDIPATVVNLESIVRGELAENSDRKDFLPSEAVAIAEAVRKQVERETWLRQSSGASGGVAGCGNLPQAATDKGTKTRDAIARGTGISGRSLAKATEIVKAAQAEPERFGKLLDDMDRTGRVDGPFKRLVVARKADAIRQEKPPLPGNGPYRVIVADPPWPYEIRQEDPSHRAAFPYPTMSIAEICALDVGGIAHQNCILWLWTTNHHIREAFTVLDAWGFQHKTMLTWAKDRIGYGDWLRGQTEHALFAVRGNPVVQVGGISTLMHGPVGRHSEKPDYFYDLVENLCPAPRYAELFQRRQRDLWDGHGDEAG